MRFVGSDVTFTINVVVNSSFVDLSFPDNGPGIPDDQDISALFERFSRLEAHRTPGHGEGGGLGLSVVKSLVEGMRGEVLFEGESPAAGASKPFKVNLRFPIVKTISGEHVVQVDVDPKVQEDVQTDQVSFN